MRQLLIFFSACLIVLVILDGLIAFKAWEHGPYGHELYRFAVVLTLLLALLITGLVNLLRSYRLRWKLEPQLARSLMTIPFSQTLLALILFQFALGLVK